MIDKAKQISKRSKDLLSARFQRVYGRLSFTQRQVLKVKFSEAHGISEGTFRNKANGVNGVSESEVEWIEAYDPYTHTQQPANTPNA